jgi:hypothetical protein
MSTIGDIVERVSKAVGDNGPDCAYVRWPLADLYQYYSEAQNWLVGLRPDAYTRDVTLSLTQGSQQTLPDAYSSLVEIKLANDKFGAPSAKSVGRGDEYYSKALRGKRCIAPADTPYAPDTYTKYAANEKTFSVSPPVPPGQHPTVQATVVEQPVPATPAQAKQVVGYALRFDPAVIEYMLYCAYRVELESATSAAKAERHLKNAYYAIDKAYKYEAAFNSGYFRGQMGDGDQRAGSVK